MKQVKSAPSSAKGRTPHGGERLVVRCDHAARRVCVPLIVPPDLMFATTLQCHPPAFRGDDRA
jgi:hypothetical protein